MGGLAEGSRGKDVDTDNRPDKQLLFCGFTSARGSALFTVWSLPYQLIQIHCAEVTAVVVCYQLLNARSPSSKDQFTKITKHVPLLAQPCKYYLSLKFVPPFQYNKGEWDFVFRAHRIKQPRIRNTCDQQLIVLRTLKYIVEGCKILFTCLNV